MTTNRDQRGDGERCSFVFRSITGEPMETCGYSRTAHLLHVTSHSFQPSDEATRHKDHPSCFEGCETTYPETCICDHPHGECVTCGCRLLAYSPQPAPQPSDEGRGAATPPKTWPTDKYGTVNVVCDLSKAAAKPEPTVGVEDDEDESLKPCPFCGGAAVYGYEDEYPEAGHFIRCQGCDASTPLVFALKEPVERKVRELWNRRV